jgi:type VI secretion system protein ImpA
MSSPPVLDLDALLAPISGDNPAGVYLRSEDRNAFDAIKSGARQGRQNEDRATPESGGAATAGMSDWRAVKPAAISALAEKTKDLEICSYLIEALLRVHGPAGMRDGFKVARELVERYWDNLYPMPDDDGDLHTRVAILGGLNGDTDTPGTLPVAITRMVLASPPGANTLYFTDYHDAVGKARKDTESGTDYLEPLRNAIKAVDARAVRALNADLKEASQEAVALEDVLSQKAGRAAPGLNYIRRELERCQDALKELAGSILDEPVDAPTTDDAGTATDGLAAGTGRAGGPVRDREGALRTLEEIASFFDKTEPHSVIPYALRQVVRWGKLSLPELLNELITDRQTRTSLYERVGIPEQSS